MKPTIQAAGEAMPTTRRSFLSALPGLAAASAIPAVLADVKPAKAAVEPAMTARERADYHLDQLRLALEEETGKEFYGEISWRLKAAFLFGRTTEGSAKS